MATVGKRNGKKQPPAGDGPLFAYAAPFLDCRNLGHVWRTIGFFDSGGVVKRRLSCQRCDTDRTDRWTRDGARLAPSYDYSTGYRIEGVTVKPWQVRVEIVRRATVYTSEADMLHAITTGQL